MSTKWQICTIIIIHYPTSTSSNPEKCKKKFNKKTKTKVIKNSPAPTFLMNRCLVCIIADMLEPTMSGWWFLAKRNFRIQSKTINFTNMNQNRILEKLNKRLNTVKIISGIFISTTR